MISSMDQRSNSLDTKTSHFFVDQIGCISTIQSIASHNEHCAVYTVCVAMDAALSAGDRGRNGTLSESTWIWFKEKLLETTGSDDPSNIDPPHALNVTVPGNVERERECVISSHWFSGRGFELTVGQWFGMRSIASMGTRSIQCTQNWWYYDQWVDGKYFTENNGLWKMPSLWWNHCRSRCGCSTSSRWFIE